MNNQDKTVTYAITGDQIRELRYAADILVDFARADRRPRIEAADTIKFITDQVLQGGAGVAPEMPDDPRPNLASEPASPANPGPIAPVIPVHAHEPAPMSATTLPKGGDRGDEGVEGRGVEGRGAVRIVEPAPVQVVAEAVTAVEEPARERGAGVERERRGGVRAGR